MESMTKNISFLFFTFHVSDTPVSKCKSTRCYGIMVMMEDFNNNLLYVKVTINRTTSMAILAPSIEFQVASLFALVLVEKTAIYAMDVPITLHNKMEHKMERN